MSTQTAVGKATISGKAYVLYPRDFVPEYQFDSIDTHLGCGTAVACKANIFNFCIGMKNHKGAYVPAITVCQNLWILDSPDTVN